uniref:Uncharacterized protein n=1 Tax=Craspedostauros australis TaxID=1486917 RepID=A0A7R9WLA2_9STRA|mmetsp:Transcript_10450/g.28775  ORF Transcript_10450/g.28775 Transcript_10450/m.28775 type:complete len:359 (+) Transcript_10450:305-1381(+)
MTKIMFLTFWYSSIFPGALFLCAITLTVNYYTDRFSLMRSWQRAPHVSTEISVYSRHYFFSAACGFLVVMTSFYWAAFPFDNMCPLEDEDVALDPAYHGTHFFDGIDRLTNETVVRNATISEDTPLFRFCNQDYIFRPDGFFFPFMYREGRDGGEWMNKEQRQLSIVFGWTSVVVLLLIGCKFVVGFVNIIRSMFFGKYEEVGEDQGLSFHEVRNISGYMPQVRSSIFSYPLLACKCDKIDQHLFDWTDPDREYTYYDLTKDADHILTGTRRKARHSFSRVMHWPPSRMEDMKRRKRLLEKRIEKSRSIFNSSGSQHASSSRFMAKSTRRNLDRMRSSFISSRDGSRHSSFGSSAKKP